MNENSVRIFDVEQILDHLPHLDLTLGLEVANDVDAFPLQAPFTQGGLYIGSFTGLTPWEMHVDTDELLYAVKGEVEVTILTDKGAQSGMLRQGSACIVPQGLWHRQFAPKGVSLLAISGPGPVSLSDDPRED